MVVAPLLVAVGLVGFDDVYGEAYGALGRAGIAALAVGVLVLGLAPLARYLQVTLPVGVALLAGATAGAVIAEAGALAIAVEIWRTETPSRRLAVLLPLALPATALVNYLGFVFDLYHMGFSFYAGVSGLAWLAVGHYTLRARRDDADAPS